MTILTFPAAIRAPSQATIRPLAQSTTHRSPFDGSVQTLFQPGMRWAATLTWSNVPIEHWRPLSGFVGSLHGMAGRFTYSHPLTWRRATAAAGTPLINGADQTGRTLATDGWTPSTLVLRAGDYISFADAAGRPRLHQVTSDVTSGVGGNAGIPIAPPLRTAPPNNGAIEIDAPIAVWMLANDEAGDVSVVGGNNNRGTVTLEIVEALYGSGIPYSGGFVLDSSELV